MQLSVKIDVSYVQFDRKAVRAASRKGGQQMRAAIRKLGGGRAVSPPGSPPGRRTGALWRSVYGRASARGYAMVAGTAATHGHFLELGTRRMDARPLVQPAFAGKQSVIIGLYRDAIGKGITATVGAPGQPPAAVEIG